MTKYVDIAFSDIVFIQNRAIQRNKYWNIGPIGVELKKPNLIKIIAQFGPKTVMFNDFLYVNL